MISVCQQRLISIIFLFWSLTARGDGVMGRNVDKSSVFASWHRSPFNRTKVHYLHYYKLHRSICQSFSLLFLRMLMNRTLRYLPWVVLPPESVDAMPLKFGCIVWQTFYQPILMRFPQTADGYSEVPDAYLRSHFRSLLDFFSLLLKEMTFKFCPLLKSFKNRLWHTPCWEMLNFQLIAL